MRRIPIAEERREDLVEPLLERGTVGGGHELAIDESKLSKEVVEENITRCAYRCKAGKLVRRGIGSPGEWHLEAILV